MRYFPDLAENEAMLVRNPFSSTIGIESIPDEVQDQFIDLRNDSTALEIFQEKSLTEFWCRMYPSYPAVSLIAVLLKPERHQATKKSITKYQATVYYRCKYRNNMIFGVMGS